ncbi:uncharacterized protein [Drosophila takahashii]|uniref:uncharacterized protein n=1 Tax=Drosophila takahashii TaxID=29030 RepID=UPI003898F8F7
MIFAWQVVLGCCLMWKMTEAEVIFKLMKVECEGNPARVMNISCRVKPINWNSAEANMDCFLTVPLISPIIRAQIFRKDYSNKFQPFLVDATFSICDVIERKSYIPYGVMIWKQLKRYSNANHSCPFSGNLTLRNALLPTELLPPFPQGFYQFRFTFLDSNSTNRDYVATVKMLFQSMEPIKSKKRPVSKNENVR